jgi:hypothetical protein
LLAELKDGHVYYETTKGKRIYPFLPPRSLKDKFSYSATVVRKYFDQDLRQTNGAKCSYGIIDGNISIGVPPDLRIPQTAQDILQGKDRQLEYAIGLLK